MWEAHVKCMQVVFKSKGQVYLYSTLKATCADQGAAQSINDS